MTTVQDAIKAIQAIRTRRRRQKSKISSQLLGKYKGILPKNKTSTQLLRELRETSYGKFK